MNATAFIPVRGPMPDLPRLTGCAAMALASSLAQAQPSPPSPEAPPPVSVHGQVSLLSDYTIRAVSQTQGKPGIRGHLFMQHASGMYLMLAGASVSRAAYPNGSGAEIDTIAGYQKNWPSGFGLDVSYGAYFYPGAHVPGESVRFHTQEVTTTLSQGDFSVSAAVVTSRYLFGLYGLDAQGHKKDNRGSIYLEANWNPQIAEGWRLNLHLGRQQVRGNGDWSFNDYKVGVTVDGSQYGLPGWSASLAWLYNDGRRSLWTFYNSDGRGKVVVGSRAIASLIYSF